MEPVHLSLDQKQSVLEQVLRSEALSRSQQLRSFLRYICEREIAGKAPEINEYAIGVEALGRPPGYSTMEDPIVRTRAYALRHKLEEFYVQEDPAAPVRITLPKGSYVPRFLPSEPSNVPAPVAPLPSGVSSQWLRIPLKLPAFWRGVLAAGLLAGILFAFSLTQMRRAHVDPTIREAWGPLASPDANVLVSVSSPPQLILTQYPEASEPLDSFVLPAPAEALEHFKLTRSVRRGYRLLMQPSQAPRLGDVLGTLVAVRTLEALGVSYEVLPERSTTVAAMRGRNVLLAGDPEVSPAIAKLLERTAFTIAYNPASQEREIRELQPGPGPQRVFTPAINDQGNYTELYGLITVIPSEGATPAVRKTVIFSGLYSAGAQAAAEFFSSANQLRDLAARFRKEGLRTFPKAYQVVVVCRTDHTLLLSYAYKAHRILEP